jgi:predicted DCC family thiol-disulfide oxidoreductase YuxK
VNTNDYPGLGEKGGKGLVLYDGVCVLCSGWFRFVAKRDAQCKFLFTAIQSDYGRALALKLGIDPDQPDTNAVLLEGNIYLRSDSALAVLSALPRWRWTCAFRLVPRPLRDRVYLLIARNRYRLLGTRAACYLGGQEYADRVIN